MTDIPRLREGGVGAQFWSVYVPTSLDGGDAVLATLEQIDVVYQMIRRYPDTFELALTADEVDAAFYRWRNEVLKAHLADSALIEQFWEEKQAAEEAAGEFVVTN